jgi:hypothetical protein
MMAETVVKYLPLAHIHTHVCITRGPEHWSRIDNAPMTAAGFIWLDYVDKRLLQREERRGMDGSSSQA